MGGNGFGHHIDLHPTKRLRSLDKPLELLQLLLWCQGGRLELAADPLFGRVFISIGPGRCTQPTERQHGCQRNAMSQLVFIVEHSDLPFKFQTGLYRPTG
ncbi:hypothetical protein D3C80_1854500 [compost metagenome]